MKKPIVHTAFALVALLAGSAALAQAYIGASAGRSDFQADCECAASCDTTDAGYKLYGVYMLNEHLGVEAALFDFGKGGGSIALPGSNVATVEARARGLGLYGVAALPIDAFSVFARAGFTYSKAKVEVSCARAGSDDQWKLTPAFGLGASYTFTRHLGARIQWERVSVEFPGAQKRTPT
jgi:OmpA-OmpF porin, OOP family